MKKFIIIFSALLFLVPMSAYAFSIKNGNFVNVDKTETIDGNLYAAGSTINVDGKVTGDIFCAGQNININGDVAGDVICAGQTVNINGNVGGNIRVAGNSVNINSKVDRNAMVVGASVTTSNKTEIGWDMTVGAASANIDGKIGRDLYGGVASMVINGQIGKNIRLRIEKNIKSEQKGVNFNESGLTITKNAKINGDLVYTSSVPANIEPGAQIKGQSTQNLPKQPEKKSTKTSHAGGWLISVFSSLVIGLVLISLWKEKIIEITDLIKQKAGASIGWGLIVTFLTPIIALLLLITIIGIPLSLIIIALWLIALCIGKIFTSILVGRILLQKFWEKKKDSLSWAMVIGIVVTITICYIPLIGWLACLAATLFGLGGLWLFFRKS